MGSYYKYITAFNTTALYNTFKQSDKYIEPNLSYLIFADTVKYNPSGVISSVSISNTSIQIPYLGSYKLFAVPTPNHAGKNGIIWLSNNDSIATVDLSGIVTGVKAGEAVITAKTIYGGFTKYCKVSVQKITPTVTAPTAKSGLIYTGSAQELVNAGSTSYGTMKYSLDNSTWSTSVPSGTNAGTYTVYYKVEGNSNINNVAVLSISVSIGKADPSYTAPTATSPTYNGSAQNLLNAGSTDHGTIQYSADNSTWSTTISSSTNAGTYTLYWRLVGDGNHNDVSPTIINVTISKANRTLSWTTSPSSIDSNATAILLATPSAGSGDGIITYSSGNNSIAVVNGDVVSGKSIGTCTITATIGEGENYLTASTSYTIIITNANYNSRYLTFTATEGGTFKFSENSLSYSLDNGATWTSLESDTDTPTVSAGSKIIWKASGLTPNSSTGIGTFSSSGNFTVEGNVMSLLYGDNFTNLTSLSGKNYAFKKLFVGCTGVTSAENLILPATTLEGNCYYYMFQNCTNLTTAPELPATTLAPYCYYGMFSDCTSLTTAPSILPATTMALSACTNMFNRCTSLTTVPELPATTLANNCYHGMFSYCNSLTTVPSNMLPATTLAKECYYLMFKTCTNLTTAPVLPATTLSQGCYYNMFMGCTSLNSITCLATDISASNCTSGWVSSVASSGTFTKAASMTNWTTGDNGIPSNWTVVNDHEYVEIGGVKWATMNIGANLITDTGLYFQWGDTQGYTASQVGSGAGLKYFGWADYKYGNGTSSPGATGMTKYNSTDGKTVLDISDDAARANWGGQWRMPTTDEYVALGYAVNTAWTADYQGSGVAGLVCTDKTDSSKVLFFPACGGCRDGEVDAVGSNGNYWSSSLSKMDIRYPYHLYFDSGYVNWQRGSVRIFGFPVRGVVG